MNNETYGLLDGKIQEALKILTDVRWLASGVHSITRKDIELAYEKTYHADPVDFLEHMLKELGL